MSMRRSNALSGMTVRAANDAVRQSPSSRSGAAGTLQPVAHLLDRLTWANADAACELVIIQRTTSDPKLLQNACGDSRASRGRMIPHYIFVRKSRS